MAFSTHWVKYVVPTMIWFILFPTSVVLFVIAGLYANHNDIVANILFIGALLMMLLVHHWYFHKLLSEAMVDVVVTNKRLIYCVSSLLRYDDIHEYTVENLIAVQAQKHGLIQNLLRYGSLWLDTGGSASTDDAAVIPLVPHPHSVARELTTLHRMA